MAEQKKVYFVQAGRTDRVKIGCASSVPKRMKELQTGCPEPLFVRLVLPCGSRKLEAELHKKFENSRVCGEWFKYEPDIKAFVAKRHESRLRQKEAEEAREQQRHEERLEQEQEEREFNRWLTRREQEHEDELEREYDEQLEREHDERLRMEREEEDASEDS